jgi:hypothetical protein
LLLLLAAVPAGAAKFDLLVAADVFVYIGELLPVLQAAAAVAADRWVQPSAKALSVALCSAALPAACSQLQSVQLRR